jgi:aerobic carbon-monoxide dehydrogenase medium subunit
VIPSAFGYVRPGSVDACLDVLARHGDEAKVLAGGHSLVPLLKLRLAAPSLLVDLGRIPGLRGIRDTGDHLAIGAMTTHDEVMHDPLVRAHCRLLAEATAVVGDPQVRHRGTLGGALAHGDAAGDLPAVAVALEAALVVAGPAGERTVPATEFFVDYLETVLAPEELLVEIRVPKLTADWGWRYEKFARLSHMWAIVGACAVVRRGGGGIAEARVGLTNMGAVPIRARATEQALRGVPLSTVPAAAALADEGVDPPADLNAEPDYRRQLARVLTRRALEEACARWS